MEHLIEEQTEQDDSQTKCRHVYTSNQYKIKYISVHISNNSNEYNASVYQVIRVPDCNDCRCTTDAVKKDSTGNVYGVDQCIRELLIHVYTDRRINRGKMKEHEIQMRFNYLIDQRKNNLYLIRRISKYSYLDYVNEEERYLSIRNDFGSTILVLRNPIKSADSASTVLVIGKSKEFAISILRKDTRFVNSIKFLINESYSFLLVSEFCTKEKLRIDRILSIFISDKNVAYKALTYCKLNSAEISLFKTYFLVKSAINEQNSIIIHRFSIYKDRYLNNAINRYLYMKSILSDRIIINGFSIFKGRYLNITIFTIFRYFFMKSLLRETLVSYSYLLVCLNDFNQNLTLIFISLRNKVMSNTLKKFLLIRCSKQIIRFYNLIREVKEMVVRKENKLYTRPIKSLKETSYRDLVVENNYYSRSRIISIEDYKDLLKSNILVNTSRCIMELKSIIVHLLDRLDEKASNSIPLYYRDVSSIYDTVKKEKYLTVMASLYSDIIGKLEHLTILLSYHYLDKIYLLYIVLQSHYNISLIKHAITIASLYIKAIDSIYESYFKMIRPEKFYLTNRISRSIGTKYFTKQVFFELYSSCNKPTVKEESGTFIEKNNLKSKFFINLQYCMNYIQEVCMILEGNITFIFESLCFSTVLYNMTYRLMYWSNSICFTNFFYAKEKSNNLDTDLNKSITNNICQLVGFPFYTTNLVFYLLNTLCDSLINSLSNNLSNYIYHFSRLLLSNRNLVFYLLKTLSNNIYQLGQLSFSNMIFVFYLLDCSRNNIIVLLDYLASISQLDNHTLKAVIFRIQTNNDISRTSCKLQFLAGKDRSELENMKEITMINHGKGLVVTEVHTNDNSLFQKSLRNNIDSFKNQIAVKSSKNSLFGCNNSSSLFKLIDSEVIDGLSYQIGICSTIYIDKYQPVSDIININADVKDIILHKRNRSSKSRGDKSKYFIESTSIKSKLKDETYTDARFDNEFGNNDKSSNYRAIDSSKSATLASLNTNSKEVELAQNNSSNTKDCINSYNISEDNTKLNKSNRINKIKLDSKNKKRPIKAAENIIDKERSSDKNIESIGDRDDNNTKLYINDQSANLDYCSNHNELLNSNTDNNINSNSNNIISNIRSNSNSDSNNRSKIINSNSNSNSSNISSNSNSSSNISSNSHSNSNSNSSSNISSTSITESISNINSERSDSSIISESISNSNININSDSITNVQFRQKFNMEISSDFMNPSKDDRNSSITKDSYLIRKSMNRNLEYSNYQTSQDSIFDIKNACDGDMLSSRGEINKSRLPKNPISRGKESLKFHQGFYDNMDRNEVIENNSYLVNYKEVANVELNESKNHDKHKNNNYTGSQSLYNNTNSVYQSSKQEYQIIPKLYQNDTCCRIRFIKKAKSDIADENQLSNGNKRGLIYSSREGRENNLTNSDKNELQIDNSYNPDEVEYDIKEINLKNRKYYQRSKIESTSGYRSSKVDESHYKSVHNDDIHLNQRDYDIAYTKKQKIQPMENNNMSSYNYYNSFKQPHNKIQSYSDSNDSYQSAIYSTYKNNFSVKVEKDPLYVDDKINTGNRYISINKEKSNAQHQGHPYKDNLQDNYISYNCPLYNFNERRTESDDIKNSYDNLSRKDYKGYNDTKNSNDRNSEIDKAANNYLIKDHENSSPNTVIDTNTVRDNNNDQNCNFDSKKLNKTEILSFDDTNNSDKNKQADTAKYFDNNNYYFYDKHSVYNKVSTEHQSYTQRGFVDEEKSKKSAIKAYNQTYPDNKDQQRDMSDRNDEYSMNVLNNKSDLLEKESKNNIKGNTSDLDCSNTDSRKNYSYSSYKNWLNGQNINKSIYKEMNCRRNCCQTLEQSKHIDDTRYSSNPYLNMPYKEDDAYLEKRSKDMHNNILNNPQKCLSDSRIHPEADFTKKLMNEQNHESISTGYSRDWFYGQEEHSTKNSESLDRKSDNQLPIHNIMSFSNNYIDKEHENNTSKTYPNFDSYYALQMSRHKHISTNRAIEAALGLLKMKRIFIDKSYIEQGYKYKTEFQIRVLEDILKITPYPSAQIRDNLAILLNLNPRSIQIWFQNARQGSERQLSREELRKHKYKTLIDVEKVLDIFHKNIPSKESESK